VVEDDEQDSNSAQALDIRPSSPDRMCALRFGWGTLEPLGARQRLRDGDCLVRCHGTGDELHFLIGAFLLAP
jgi:hypothetical protein